MAAQFLFCCGESQRCVRRVCDGLGSVNEGDGPALRPSASVGTDWTPSGWRKIARRQWFPKAQNRLDIFCIGADNQMYHKARTDNAWVPEATDWRPLGCVLAIFS